MAHVCRAEAEKKWSETFKRSGNLRVHVFMYVCRSYFLEEKKKSTHFDFLGGLEYWVGDFLDVVLVLVGDRLGDFVFEQGFSVSGLFLDFLFQLVDFLEDFRVGVFAHDFPQFVGFGFQLWNNKTIKKCVWTKRKSDFLVKTAIFKNVDRNTHVGNSLGDKSLDLVVGLLGVSGRAESQQLVQVTGDGHGGLAELFTDFLQFFAVENAGGHGLKTNRFNE